MTTFKSTHKKCAQLCLSLLIIFSSSIGFAQKLSPSEAAASARNFTGGKVLKVKPMKGKNVDYRVKMLSPEGRVRNIIVDGNSGEVRIRNKKQNHPSPKTKDLRKGFQ